MKMSSTSFATLAVAVLLTGVVGCGGETATVDTPVSIEAAQKEAKSRIQREYGATNKNAAKLK
jgi:hypothetical protein